MRNLVSTLEVDSNKIVISKITHSEYLRLVDSLDSHYDPYVPSIDLRNQSGRMWAARVIIIANKLESKFPNWKITSDIIPRATNLDFLKPSRWR